MGEEEERGDKGRGVEGGKRGVGERERRKGVRKGKDQRSNTV